MPFTQTRCAAFLFCPSSLFKHLAQMYLPVDWSARHMEGDREPGCLSPFTALWTWTRNGYHMADGGERKEEPCMNLAEFMEVKEEVKKKKTSCVRATSGICSVGMSAFIYSFKFNADSVSQFDIFRWSQGLFYLSFCLLTSLPHFLFLLPIPGLPRASSPSSLWYYIHTFVFMYLIINLWASPSFPLQACELMLH